MRPQRATVRAGKTGGMLCSIFAWMIAGWTAAEGGRAAKVCVCVKCSVGRVEWVASMRPSDLQAQTRQAATLPLGTQPPTFQARPPASPALANCSGNIP